MKLFALTLFVVPMVAYAAEKPYPEAGSGGARYEVPTDDDSLKPYAMYPITDIRTDENGGQVTIHYTLPLELTGAVNTIELKSTDKATDGTYTNFEGPKGDANCDASSCNVRYHNLTLDSQAARSLLVSQGIGGVELEKRMELMREFSGDPAGIIHFDQSALK